VTYCPLCNSGLPFERTVDGEVLDCGTSGRLVQSNLVMYTARPASFGPSSLAAPSSARGSSAAN
jgi:hypothetical protein